MQVYELLAAYNLYLQTDQPLGKHPFQVVLRVAPEQSCVAFECSLLPSSTDVEAVSGVVNSLAGLHRYQLVNAASDLNFAFEYWNPFAAFGLTLYRAFNAGNILYLTVQGSFDAQRQVIIHHALAVADERAPQYRSAGLDKLEDSFQLAFVNGSIACVGSGAGLVMAAADALQRLIADPQLRVYALAEIEEAHLLTHLSSLLRGAAALQTRIIIVTIFTTFVSCAAIADILIDFYCATPDIRLIAQLEGIDSEHGIQKLQGTPIQAVRGFAMMAHAVQLNG
ncbi:MAG: hypothetical protein SNJ54_00510 [Anaerolineae bacterium]